MSKFTVTVSSAALLLALAAPAWATADPSTAAQAAPAAATSTPTTNAGALPTVVVTASRRAENLQKTPIPVSVISGEQLERQGILQAQDLNKAAPGLDLSPNGASTQVYLRGIGTFAISTYADSAVAFNVDQVYLAFSDELAGNFYDLQRVEVLKGPQGTLYGRNATAGAINVISNKPSFIGYGGDLSLEVGDYDLVRLTGDVNMPVNDQLALRAAFQVVSRDGYFTDGSGDDKSDSVRLQGLYKPNSNFSLLLGADYTHVYGRGEPNVPLGSDANSNPWLGPSTAASNSQIALANAIGSGRGAPYGSYGPGANFPLVNNDSRVESDLYGVRAEANWDLGFATFTAIPAFRHMDQSSIVEPGFIFFGDGTGHQESLELRLSSPSSSQPFKWIVGAYGLGTDIVSSIDVDQGVAAQYQQVNQTGSSYAVFGESTYSVTSKLRLTGGLRYTDEIKRQTGSSLLTQYVIPQGPFLPPAPLPPFAQNVDFGVSGHLNETNLSGRAGIEYDLTPRNMLYGSFSTGFKAGGFNPDIAPNTYKPEELTAYTLGSKNRFLGGKLQLNLELFYWDYRNHQENVLGPLNADPEAFAPFTRNIGKATLYGENLDAQYLLTPNDLFSAQVEHLTATFNNFTFDVASEAAPVPGAQTGCKVSSVGGGESEVNCSGEPFTRAPDWTGILAYQHTFPLANGADIVAGVNTKITTSYYIATDYIPNELQKSAATTNLNIGYEPLNKRWSLTAYVRNVTNVAVASGGFEHPFIPGLVYGTISAPRTYSFELSTHF
jgi:iron complex outermembrane receptor protein